MTKMILAAVAALAFLNSCPRSPETAILSSWTGTGEGASAPACLLVEDGVRWAAVWEEQSPGVEPPDVDFGDAVVVALRSDFGVAGNRFDAEVLEEAGAVRLRCRHRVVQVKGEAPRRTVWGFYVLPRAARPIVVELATSGNKGRETIWEEQGRFE